MVQNKGYSEAGASHKKRALKGFNAMSGSPREDIDYNNYTLRQRGRMLYMGAPVATGAIKRSRTNAIGLGLKPNPKINKEILGISQEQAEKWERRTKLEFALWAENKRACDATGVNDFYEMQQLCYVSWLISGDVFIARTMKETDRNMPYSLRLHVIEADRISTPTKYADNFITDGTASNGNKIYDGVEVDSGGMIQAYYVRNTYPYQYTGELTEWVRVEAVGKETGLPNMIQIMNSERADQYRGVTFLAPVVESILQIKRYTESELMAAIVESFFTAFIKTESEASDNPFNEVGEDGAEKVSYDPNEYEMGPGQINVMNPGEDVAFADPKRPAGGFDGFVTAICNQIGTALEIPTDLLLEKFNSSYSASRAALMEAWKSFKMYRQWFVSDFCNPVYEIWLSEAVARGRIACPGFFSDPLIRKAWLNCEWIGPAQGQLDPVKEITAEIMAVEHGYSTNEDSTVRLNGGDWNANMDKLEREREKLKKMEGSGNESIRNMISNVINKTIKESIQEMKGEENAKED